MKRPLTIALVRTNFPSESSGGSTFEDEVLRAAVAAPSRHKLVIYPETPRARALVDELGAAHRVSFVKELKKPRLPRRFFRRAKRSVLRRKRPLPFAELGEHLKRAGANCAWMMGGSIIPLDMPYVATLWDLQHRLQPWFPEVSSGGEWRERERLYSEFLGRAAAIVTGTRAGALEIESAYGSALSRTHVIPMPTPAFALSAGLRPRGSRPAELPPRYLLYPAQFWSHKNHVTAVRALSHLTGLLDPPQLIFVGADRGVRAHVLAEAEALGVSHRVQFLGFVPQARLVMLYQHAEALVFPSLFGPDNLPPLEAMALGCPVIAARVSGAEEQIGDAGILVDGLDAQAFADAVSALRSDGAARAHLVERGRERARRWSTAQYAAAVLELFESRIAPMRELWP